jgi:hypothetical protein
LAVLGVLLQQLTHYFAQISEVDVEVTGVSVFKKVKQLFNDWEVTIFDF